MIKRASEGDWFWLSDKSASKQRRRKGRRRCAGLSRSVTVRERVGASELVDGDGEEGAWGDDFVLGGGLCDSEPQKKNGEDERAATLVLPIDLGFYIYIYDLRKIITIKMIFLKLKIIKHIVIFNFWISY